MLEGLGLALGRGGGRLVRAASYCSFQDTDSDFSTTSSTRGDSEPGGNDLGKNEGLIV